MAVLLVMKPSISDLNLSLNMSDTQGPNSENTREKKKIKKNDNKKQKPQ